MIATILASIAEGKDVPLSKEKVPTNPIKKEWKVSGTTKAQREWVRERDHNRCCFYKPVDGKWVRCKNTDRLEVHHLQARGYCSLWFPNKEINVPSNLITLCPWHHRAEGMPQDQWIYAIHPDCEVARLQHRKGDHQSFNKMMAERLKLNQQGFIYHNGIWDIMLYRVAEKHTAVMKRPYPYRWQEGVEYLGK